jgi:metal-responsive CopG/Arc/MetJ family transcriptional regulator
MKTAISIPDATFERAERRARELGVSRSEFYATAVQHWLDALESEQITDHIDRVLDAAPPNEQELAFLARAAARLASCPTG